jgi:hypothetical protein
VDPEALAMAEVARRARRGRLAVAAPILVAGLALGVAGYVVLREAFFATIHGHVPYLTGALSILPALTLAWSAATAAGRALVRWRAPRWAEEVGAMHGVPRESLAQLASML